MTACEFFTVQTLSLRRIYVSEQQRPLRFVVHESDAKLSAAFDEVFRT